MLLVRLFYKSNSDSKTLSLIPFIHLLLFEDKQIVVCILPLLLRF